MLLERKDISPNEADTGSGRTPLSLAAGGGNEGIVKDTFGRRGRQSEPCKPQIWRGATPVGG